MARKTLFQRLPAIWRRLDAPTDSAGNIDPDSQGLLERYLGVWDEEFARGESLIDALFSLRDAEKIPDQFLRLLADIVGYDWRENETRTWNRLRLQEAIKRHSARGSQALLDVLITEAGGGDWSVTDMASTILIPGKQGNLGTGNAFLIAADYHHHGAFALYISEDVDLDVLKTSLNDWYPAGTVWFFFSVGFEVVLFEALWTDALSIGAAFDSDRAFGIGRDTLGVDLYLSFESHYWDASILVLAETGVTGAFLQMDSPITIDDSRLELSMGGIDALLPTDKAGIHHCDETV